MSGPYEQSWDSEGKPFVEGPSSGGMSYYGGTLWPAWHAFSEEQAKVVAQMCNAAYEQGIWAAQRRMRETLGI